MLEIANNISQNQKLLQSQKPRVTPEPQTVTTLEPPEQDSVVLLLKKVEFKQHIDTSITLRGEPPQINEKGNRSTLEDAASQPIEDGEVVLTN